MTEEQVAKAVMAWLSVHGWEILDYDFPGGGTGRRFRFSAAENPNDKNAGAFCPDIVAWKDGRFLLCENKAADTPSDYDKQARVKSEPTLADQLHAAYPDKSLTLILTAIAFSGPFVNQDRAATRNIDFVLSILENNDVTVSREPGSFTL